MVKFKEFLLNENSIRLGKRVGDVLNSVHELQDDMDNISLRHLKRISENIVNQIRRILHSQWPTEQHKYLKRLQAIGVAIMKTLEEKGDIRQVLQQVSSELETLSKKLGVKINDIEPPDNSGEQAPMDLTAQQDKDMSKKPEMPPNQQPQQPEMPGMTPMPANDMQQPSPEMPPMPIG